MLIVKYHHDMPSPSDQVAALDRVLELALLLNADMTRGLSALGLTESRTRVVWHLLQAGPSTQRAIADALEVSPRNVTGLVDGLVRTGFVRREPHPTDRRATLVHLTDQGARTGEDSRRGRTSSPVCSSPGCRRRPSPVS